MTLRPSSFCCKTQKYRLLDATGLARVARRPLAGSGFRSPRQTSSAPPPALPACPHPHPDIECVASLQARPHPSPGAEATPTSRPDPGAPRTRQESTQGVSTPALDPGGGGWGEAICQDLEPSNSGSSAAGNPASPLPSQGRGCYLVFGFRSPESSAGGGGQGTTGPGLTGVSLR